MSAPNMSDKPKGQGQMQQIKNRWSDEVFLELEAADIKSAVVAAIKDKISLSGAYLSGAYLSGAYLRGADLRGADLRGAYLSGANLSGANLRGADLRGADLRGAYLRGAYLSGAYLSGAYLRGADLSGAVIAWQSHDLIAHLLFTKAEDDIEKRSLAGLILISRDWCWDQFMRLEHPERQWAIDILKAQNPDGMPDLLRAILNSTEGQ